MRAVNLLPSDSAQRKSFRKEDPAVVVGSTLPIISGGAAWTFARSTPCGNWKARRAACARVSGATLEAPTKPCSL